MSALFSAVFSELGSNQVVSRILAQCDAIALQEWGAELVRDCDILEGRLYDGNQKGG